MQRRDGSFVFSPSDLNAFLACEHLTALELAVAHGQRGQHEAAFLQRLRDQRLRVAAFELDGRRGVEAERERHRGQARTTRSVTSSGYGASVTLFRRSGSSA